MTATGPSTRATCRIINANSCGSGTYCGDGYILTNAHVAGTKIGRQVQVDVESLDRRITATVVRAAYSDAVIADWALLKCEHLDIEPVYLSKKPPSGTSFYTKGFPRCQPMTSGDVNLHRIISNGVALWTPDAIGGQSGSGVFSDLDNFVKFLLTWSWSDGGRRYGAGQLTSEIYKQNRATQLSGFVKPDGLVELVDYDMTGINMLAVHDDPVVEDGLFGFIPRGIQDYPIWAEDHVEPPSPPDDRPEAFTNQNWQDYCRDVEELHERWRLKFEVKPPTTDNGTTDPDEPIFGL